MPLLQEHLSDSTRSGNSAGGKMNTTDLLYEGRPTYVAVWEVIDKEIQLVEVSYVGTHEKAPY